MQGPSTKQKQLGGYMLPDDANNSQHPLPNYFEIIPAYILDDERIDDSTAVLFCRISQILYPKGYCRVAAKYLCELAGVDEQLLSNRLKALEDCGYIKVTETLGDYHIVVNFKLNKGM